MSESLLESLPESLPEHQKALVIMESPKAPTANVAYPMGLTLAGSVMIGFFTAGGFWIFGDPISTNRISWVILCLALSLGMLIHHHRERFFSTEVFDPALFDSNRRCGQALMVWLFVSVFCGCLSLAATASSAPIYGFLSVMFLTASLVFYMHIDVRNPVKF